MTAARAKHSAKSPIEFQSILFYRSLLPEGYASPLHSLVSLIPTPQLNLIKPEHSTHCLPMTVLQIGNQTFTADEIILLLNEYSLLPQLQREVLIDQAIGPSTCSPEETDFALQQFYQQQQLPTEAHRRLWLEQQSLTELQLQQRVIRSCKLEKFKQVTWGNQIETYFLQRKSELDRVLYSLLRTQEVGIAQELYFRIQEGEQSFDELARQYSQGPEAETGGLVGPLELQTLNPDLAKLLSTLQPGQLATPTYLGEWLAIVRLEKFIPAQLDEPMRQRLLNECFNQWLKTQLQQQPTPRTLVVASS